jgi:hypothetical protein
MSALQQYRELNGLGTGVGGRQHSSVLDQGEDGFYPTAIIASACVSQRTCIGRDMCKEYNQACFNAGPLIIFIPIRERKSLFIGRDMRY